MDNVNETESNPSFVLSLANKELIDNVVSRYIKLVQTRGIVPAKNIHNVLYMYMYIQGVVTDKQLNQRQQCFIC